MISKSLQLRAKVQNFCPSCMHSLINNQHGFDQNDGHMEGDKLIHSGKCTYCKKCNPWLEQRINEVKEPTLKSGS
jgi:hypothetical protein